MKESERVKYRSQFIAGKLVGVTPKILQNSYESKGTHGLNTFSIGIFAWLVSDILSEVDTVQWRVGSKFFELEI